MTDGGNLGGNGRDINRFGRIYHKNKTWSSSAMALKSASAVTTRARRSDARAREKRWLVASG